MVIYNDKKFKSEYWVLHHKFKLRNHMKHSTLAKLILFIEFPLYPFKINEYKHLFSIFYVIIIPFTIQFVNMHNVYKLTSSLEPLW